MENRVRNEVLGAVMIAVIVLAFVAGFSATYFFVGSGATITTTIVKGPNTILISPVCIITGEGRLIVTAIDDSSGKPISSVPIQLTYLPSTCPSTHTETSLGILSTNDSGIIILCCELGEYFFSVNYLGSHSFNATIEPERVTCVTLKLPSGELSIAYSQTFQSICSG